MPDEGLTPTATSAATTGASAAPTPAGAESASAGAEAPQAPDPYAVVSGLDVEELIRRDPRLQGKIGALAQKQALAEITRLRREQDVQEQRRAEQARLAELEHLARNDPDRLAQETLKEARAKKATAHDVELWETFKEQTSTQLRAQLDRVYDNPIVKEIQASADADTLRKMHYDNHETIADWQDFMTELIAERKAEKKAGDKAKQLVAAAATSGRIDAMATEASEGVDLGLGGTVPGGRIFRRSEINPHTREGRALYVQHRDAIRYQMEHGLLIDD